MARRPRPTPPPPPPPEAPLAAEVLTAPGSFFKRLRAVPPRPWRYAAPPVLASLLAGAVYALLLRPVVAVTAEGAGAFAAHATNAFGTFFLTVLGAGLMAGLGRLGAGREGRAAEVYGATFVLLPPLYLLLAALLLVLPGPETGGATAAAGAGALAAPRAALESAAQAPLTRTALGVLLLAPLAQFALAYRGFVTLTGDRRRALLGTLLPVLPTLAVTALGLAPLLAALF